MKAFIFIIKKDQLPARREPERVRGSHGIVRYLGIGVERSGRTDHPAEGGEAPLENEKKYSSGIFQCAVYM